jgi:hypothetical protein
VTATAWRSAASICICTVLIVILGASIPRKSLTQDERRWERFLYDKKLRLSPYSVDALRSLYVDEIGAISIGDLTSPGNCTWQSCMSVKKGDSGYSVTLPSSYIHVTILGSSRAPSTKHNVVSLTYWDPVKDEPTTIRSVGSKQVILPNVLSLSLGYLSEVDRIGEVVYGWPEFIRVTPGLSIVVRPETVVWSIPIAGSVKLELTSDGFTACLPAGDYRPQVESATIPDAIPVKVLLEPC